ncbi:hypothetical protein GE061_007123 [Apolygus lucorum]|uniref:Uncharacterized protein n=1 Tax=Apolygus lucorum TaxID=248454 RepID=A0A6A4IU83_APOLU|nr:hypothetical protein GE061_007123 [Apolygus lucorum]
MRPETGAEEATPPGGRAPRPRPSPPAVSTSVWIQELYFRRENSKTGTSGRSIVEPVPLSKGRFTISWSDLRAGNVSSTTSLCE